MKRVNLYYGMLFIITIFILPCCSNNPEITENHLPMLIVDFQTDGLGIAVAGSAIDEDGSISDVYIDWGDSNKSRIMYQDYADFKESHHYMEPSTYLINLLAIDNEKDTSWHSFSVNIDYKETSLTNIKEGLFKSADNEYLILTINLHTYQETNQNEKFKMLTDVIGLLDIDFIALQECAQHKSSEIVDGLIRVDNMALIITNDLFTNYQADYNFIWNWAHYGWDVWEEGEAILSKHQRLDSDEKYISSNTSVSNITSRKAISGLYQISEGQINFLSTHTHWRVSESDEEQNNQINNIKQMVDEKESLNEVLASFVCGDFNVNPTSEYPWSEGYNNMVQDNMYIDSFLDVYPDANNIPTQNIYNTIEGDLPGRIDYIFMKQNAHFEIIDSQIIFTEDVVGKISDHYGVITKIAVSAK